MKSLLKNLVLSLLMYSVLNDIFEQAVRDHNSTNLDGDTYESRMYYGIKIVRENESKAITIYDTARGGDYYKELEEEEYDLFFDFGWKTAVRKLTLVRYKDRLKSVEEKIKHEINGRNNAKYLVYLKEIRANTMNKYYNVTQKLNQNVKST